MNRFNSDRGERCGRSSPENRAFEILFDISLGISCCDKQ